MLSKTLVTLFTFFAMTFGKETNVILDPLQIMDVAQNELQHLQLISVDSSFLILLGSESEKPDSLFKQVEVSIIISPS